MIPLARWLEADDQPAAAVDLSAFAAEVTLEPGLDAETLERQRQDAIDESYRRGRSEAVAECEAASAAALEAQKALFAARGAEIEAKWMSRLSVELTSGIAQAFSEMRTAIETAMAEVLTPFLQEEVRRKTSAAFFESVALEAANGRMPVEISAPAHLHDQIRLQGELQGLSLPLSDSPEIRVIFRDGMLRFDDMSQQWLETVKGIET